MPILRAEGVVAGYGGVPVVQGISAQLDAGQVVALVGPNGAGKSTFLKALFGLIPKSAGTVTVGGNDISRVPPHMIARSGMAYVPQVDNVFPSLSVIENLEMGGYVRTDDVRQRVDEVLEIFPDLSKARRVKGGTLSGGQKNMLAMARGLMVSPQVVLLDEPTAGLSPAYTQVVWQQIQRVAASGAGVLVVEQNVDLAIVHADYVYVLVAGRNRMDGPAAEIQRVDLGSIFLGHDHDANGATMSDQAAVSGHLSTGGNK